MTMEVDEDMTATFHGGAVTAGWKANWCSVQGDQDFDSLHCQCADAV